MFYNGLRLSLIFRKVTILIVEEVIGNFKELKYT